MAENKSQAKRALLLHALCVGVCCLIFMALFKALEFEWWGGLGGGVGGALGYLLSHGLLSKKADHA